MNFLARFVENCRLGGNRTAVIYQDKSLTYGELLEATGRAANLLRRLGVKPGDRVAFALNNRPEFLFIYLGAIAAGAIAVPINYLLKSEAIAYNLNNCEASLFVGNVLSGPEFLKASKQIPSVRHYLAGDELQTGVPLLRELMAQEQACLDLHHATEGETALIKYTSGTTGRPKGVMTTHGNVIALMEALSSLHDPSPEDVTLLFVPLFHGAGDMCVMNSSLWVGSAFVMQDPFSPEAVLSAIERHHISVFGGIPSMLYALMNFPGASRYDLSSVRYCGAGGDSMPPEQLKKFEGKFSIPVLEGYGLTEGTAVSAFNRLDRPRKPLSVGPPIPGVELKIVDDGGQELPAGERGEVIVAGKQNMKGYWGDPEATAITIKDGWLYTGDVGRVDNDGYLYILDRKKELIIMSGENISPRELENIIYQHPAIAEAAVVGVADERRGQAPKAILVLKPGQELSAEEFLAFCRRNMAFFQVPRIVEFRDSLPKGPTGKIDKKLL